ncbi:MAG: CDP-diacylglycerol--serine O-phosphatidyltransferase [Litorivivens sp.]|jgi:CDP-diacylglycerol--serine O-phosphatidyltransferase
MASWLVILAAFFDFLDGFAARMLGVSGELGKQLDSIADMVSFGLVPGIIAYELLKFGLEGSSLPSELAYAGLFVTLMSCLRLAKFNIDTRQSDQFIGFPTPAITLFWLGVPFFLLQPEALFAGEIATDRWLAAGPCTWWLVALSILTGVALVSPFPLLALKFKTFGFKENMLRYMLIGSVVIAMVGGYFVFGNPFQPLPIVILLYFVISLVGNASSKQETVAE